MKKIFLKTIYILITILYIFGISSAPLSISEMYSESHESGNTLSYLPYTLSNVNAVKNKEVEQISFDKYSTIHQIEDEKYKNVKLSLDEESESRTISSTTSAYSLHTNTRNGKEVMGFLPYWSLSTYARVQYDKLSTVSYFSLTCTDVGAWVKGYLADNDGDGDKEWSDDGGYVGFNSSNFTNMVNLAHSYGTKVVLVVKNFDPYSIRQIVRNVNGSGDALINNIVNAISSKGLDGVNIDFEYVPKLERDAVTDQLRADFAKWHDVLADRIHSEFPGAIVSTDTFGSAGVSYSIYDMSALGKTSIDYIVMMTYDYITTSCWNGKKMGPMSPLYGNFLYDAPWNTSTHLTAGANKAGKDKIVMGVPYYGIDFEVKTIDKDKYNAYVNYPNCLGNLETYGSIVDPIYDDDHNPDTIKWNNTEKATWYVYQDYNTTRKVWTWRHGYYDDERSLAAKYDFVVNSGIRGIGIWALGYDRHASELYNVMKEKFQIIPFYVAFNSNVSEQRALQIIAENSLTVDETLGSGLYKVSSSNILSSKSMSNLRKYPEVFITNFNITSNSRSINQ